MIVTNLKSQLQQLLAPDSDTYSTFWVKFVDRIDPNKEITTGYMYQGDFINDGAAELGSKSRLIIAHAAYRDNSNPEMPPLTHRLVKIKYITAFLHPNGRVQVLSPMREYDTQGKEKYGWALAMRDEICALLDQLAGQPTANPLATFDDLQLLAELAARGYTLTKIEPIADSPDEGTLASIAEVRRLLQQLKVMP